MVCVTAPAVRVAIGEELGTGPGSVTTGQVGDQAINGMQGSVREEPAEPLAMEGTAIAVHAPCCRRLSHTTHPDPSTACCRWWRHSVRWGLITSSTLTSLVRVAASSCGLLPLLPLLPVLVLVLRPPPPPPPLLDSAQAHPSSLSCICLPSHPPIHSRPDHYGRGH